MDMPIVTSALANWTSDIAAVFARWPWIVPVLELAGGLVGGVIVRNTIFAYAERLVKKTHWRPTT